MRVTVAEALRAAARRLEAVSDSARLDAELLMAHALGMSRSDMLLRNMTAAAPDGFAVLLERRAQHEPVAYILGHKEFYGLEFEVNPGVLIPRMDSETLIDAARQALADCPPRRVLDLGTGSGALLLTALMLWPEAEGVGIERDSQARAVARRNAQKLGINRSLQELAEAGTEPAPVLPGHAGEAIAGEGRARFRALDWRKRGWAEDLGRFDLILANPPYVADDAELGPDVRDWEPAGALFAGPEGLDDYRILIPQLPQLLNDAGVAVFEIGAGQAEAVGEIAGCNGFATSLQMDLGGRPRAMVLRRTCDGACD